MRMSSLSAIALIVVLCPIIAGCGGEGPPTPRIVGVYAGQTAGDGQGVIRFSITVVGVLRGNMTLPPVCGTAVTVTGTASPNGAVTFEGRACGINFTGTGQVQLDPSTQRYTGSGTWTGSNGTAGTWSVDWQGRTGSISC